MSKVIFNTAMSNADDAGFRAWATELYNAIISCGLVQTADTGQLATPVVASRPVNGQVAGYWIFRFNDALQGTAPIFLKISPGRGSNGNATRLLVQIGTGSDGAGNLTGAIITFDAFNTSTSSASGAMPSYFNHDSGFFGFAFKSGTMANGLGFCVVCRTTDDAGNPTAEGFFMATRGGAVSGVWGGFWQSATDGSWCCPPFPRTVSQIGSDYQAYKCYGVFPITRIVPQIVAVLNAELPTGSLTGAVEVMDGVSRNYIGLGAATAALTAVGASTFQICMKWD